MFRSFAKLSRRCREQSRWSNTFRPGLEALEARETPTVSLGFALGMGDANNDDHGYAVAKDSAGNVYMTGDFNGTVDFDPGPGTTNLTSAGYNDIFVAKYTSAGNLVWAVAMGGSYPDQGNAIAVDASGNVYTTGMFKGTADFDPGANTFNLTSAGDTDTFISKLDGSGNFVWAVQLGGSGGDGGQGIAVDSSGNVLSTGYFRGTVDFDPGSGDVDFTNAGAQDIYISKLNSSGAYIWAQTFGSSYYDLGQAIAVDGAGNVYTTGIFQQTIDFDPGSNTFNLTSAGGDDVFVSKLDSAGNFVWAGDLGGSGGDVGYGIALDAARNVFVSGRYSGTADFDPGLGTFNLTSSSSNGFLCKLTSSGAFGWAADMGLVAQAVATDAAGNVFTTGYFANTTDFDPGLNTFDLTSAGRSDVFVCKLDNNGNFLWAVDMGGAYYDFGLGITVDAFGHIYTTGYFMTTADFDPGPGTYNLTSAGGADIFLCQLTEAGVLVVESGGSTDVTEGGNTDTYTVVLTSQPTGDVTISFGFNPLGQVTLSASSLVFHTSDWSTPQTVTVTAVDDQVFEGPHNATITHTPSSGDGAYNGIPVASVIAHITDNDNPANVIFSTGGGVFAILEGKSRTYTAVLSAAPTSDVTLTLSLNLGTNPPPQLNLSTTTLTFTTADWKVPHPVTLTAVDNSMVDGNRTVRIAYSISTLDSNYASSIVPDQVVNIADDDNVLLVNGTEGADALTVIFAPTLIQVINNGKVNFYSINYSEVLVLAGAGNNTVRLTNPTLPVTVLGGTGFDSVIIDGQANANTFTLDTTTVNVNGKSVSLLDTDALTINGKGKNDILTIATMPNFTVNFQGGAGTDTIVAPDLVNSWKITGADAGTLDNSITFGSAENLTGGVANDTFVFGFGKLVSGRVDGGGGTNSLDFSAYKTAITANLQTSTITGTRGFANIASITGGLVADKLIGANQPNTWNITSANTGTVNALTFRGFENLTGGSMADTFLFANGQGIAGTIDGAGGIDLLDYGSYASTAVTINLQTKKATGIGGFLNMEQFNGGGGMDTLIGANLANIWNLTGPNAGNVGASIFSNFENLTGGIFADTFNIAGAATWLGLLDGGAGSDTLATVGGAYVITGLNAGTINGYNFKSVEIRH